VDDHIGPARSENFSYRFTVLEIAAKGREAGGRWPVSAVGSENLIALSEEERREMGSPETATACD